MANIELPHHRLIAYQVALELIDAVVSAQISDSGLRNQALRAAKSACLNIAEAAGRSSPKDRARVFLIARGEAGEAAAGVEIAVRAREAKAEVLPRVLAIADRLVALLTGLAR
jgi:four helix bundle protein